MIGSIKLHIISLVESTELCALGFQELVKNGAAMNKQLKDSRYCLNTFPRFMAKHTRVLMIVIYIYSCQSNKKF